MKNARKYLLILALMATAASSIPIPSHAGGIARSPHLQTAVVGGPEEESGALFAMGCGLAMRFWPALGWNFAYNVGLVGTCMLALLYAA